MHLGHGRPITQPKSWETWLWSAPGFGKFVYDLLKPFKALTDDSSANPAHLVCGLMGMGKTNGEKILINQQIEQGLGGIVLDGKEGKDSLGTYTVQRLAEVGWNPEKCFILDFFSKFGHPMVDPLYDDRKDDVSWFEIVEELVSATAVMASSSAGLLDRGKSMARMAWQSLMLAGRPAADMPLFLMDAGIRKAVVRKAAQYNPILERFWLGYPDPDKKDFFKDAYVDKLGRDVLESTRNKTDLFLHPAIKSCFSVRDTHGEFAQIFDFMQNGGWWIVPLSENHLKMEFRQTVAHLVQYLLKLAALKRQEVEEKPFFLVSLDEYQHYKSPITHGSMLEEIARSQNIGLHFLCQNVASFSNPEMHALAECGTLRAYACEESCARDMVTQIFQPKGETFKDWKGEKANSIRDELDQYVGLVMEQQRGQSIVRVKPDKQAYFLEVPLVPDPKVTPKQEQAFREAVAKRWYRPRKS